MIPTFLVLSIINAEKVSVIAKILGTDKILNYRQVSNVPPELFYSLRIIGFSLHTGNPNGIAVCCMFNKIIANKALPKCLSSDNDPLFESRRWKSHCHGLFKLPVVV